MKKLITCLLALCALNASANTDQINAKLLSNKIKIVAFGKSGWDARWREPTCSVSKSDKDENGRPYLTSYYDMCTCQNSIQAKYLIEDTQDNPKDELVICYLNK
ncbi:hypothetical protein [Pseudoalteromonas luteoviolacea]|uniref:Uncharacterized protein n=1 Tax=Pseudoalteromonas luteoviolacea S4054 TaxID=1129367 RepID=A0A0F6A7X1_9GAMM|nr:hypothetical protein [Pseudoalteromonas luteoviolacea]AOT11125.1 hypothetical protein S4054249_25160 [Pseudoalteromonas luteoviolacea]AOT15711.1 hypothetical protein S40542_23350 [Pseudoalteromonas luteoviolacea]AOT20946.1 hypothetical protein S4054_25080 [Pseudoalteromonas luteoviolacea]KKE82228.1 hypothetical protein N479_19210 [Pseudoalteromonas luteoviolacea S4054]KZN65439.1 hypothetical protein N481_25120 [Pseudoalteromonas luteoviolacea S4047-1]